MMTEGDTVWLAIASGFPPGLDEESFKRCGVITIKGTVQDLASKISETRIDPDGLHILALNQSAILPSLAIRRLLGLYLKGLSENK
jgi:hypothetical protein